MRSTAEAAENETLGHLPRELSQNAHSDATGKTVPVALYLTTVRQWRYATSRTVRHRLPRYLLSPEVVVLLAHEPDQKKRLLIETFWNTGGRLNEVLAPDDARALLLLYAARMITQRQDDDR